MTVRTFQVAAIALLVTVALTGWALDVSAAPKTYTADPVKLLPGCQASFNYGELQSVRTEYIKTNDGGWFELRAIHQDANLTFTVYRSLSRVTLFVFYKGRFSSSPSVYIVGKRPQLTVDRVYVASDSEVLGYTAGQEEELFCKATNLLRYSYRELVVQQLFERELFEQRALKNPAKYIR